MPSPILIFGDIYVSKNDIIAAKKKYSALTWKTMSATDDTLNSIRMEAGYTSWDDEDKVLLIKELPNRKQVREFLLNLAANVPPKIKIIIWDSEGQIKVDPKDKTIDKTWSEFISRFKGLYGSKVINNGEMLTEKQSEASIEYVTECFGKYNKKIDHKDAKLLMSIVGYDRGMLASDIKKMSLTCPKQVTAQFIIDNAFPTTKESLLYKLGNVLDNGSLEESIDVVEKFLSSGYNENEIAVIIARKARWQMVIVSLWHSGMNWESIPNKIMEMGKFPSAIWHNDQMSDSQKKQASEPLQDPEAMNNYMVLKGGVPSKYFKSVENRPSKVKTSMSRKNAEIMPMYFMAEQAVNFVKERIVKNSKVPHDELKDKLLNRAIKVYLSCQKKLAEIRYGNNPSQDLREMIREIVHVVLI